MIWRTCGSLSRSSARSAYSTRGGRVHRPGRDETEVLRRVRVVPKLAQATGELGRRPEGRHPIAADQAGDGRVVHARLLRQLALRHLLGFELGPQPLVEGSAVLCRHVEVGAPSGSAIVRGSSPRVIATIGWGLAASVSPVGTDGRDPRPGVGERTVRWGRAGSGAAGVGAAPGTFVRGPITAGPAPAVRPGRASPVRRSRRAGGSGPGPPASSRTGRRSSPGR